MATDDDIKNLGEFGLIRKLTADIRNTNAGTITGVGDDAAVLDYTGKRVVVTTDMLTEGVHFNLVYTPLKHLGYKAAIVNFSDIYAMNARVKQLLVAIAVSAKFSVAMVEEIYAGLRLACQKHGVDLVGGDTTSSLTGLTICCTAIGECEPGSVVHRYGSGSNDLICVSGDLGAAYMGLQVLERELLLYQKDSSIQPVLEGYDYILERQLKPEARKDIVDMLAAMDVKPTSMIDISDGLSSELMHLCHASKKGCRIFAEKLPIHPQTRKTADEFNLEPLIAALNGGEDYELLFTLSLNDHEKIRNRHEITVIGHMLPEQEGKMIRMESGTDIELKAQGWNGLSR